MEVMKGHFLVQSGAAPSVAPVIATTVPLSFWGGIDQVTGKVVDVSHPLHQTNVSESIFLLPSGRGSCTASQVLLELILNRKSPRAIVLRDVDGLLCVGALIAQEVFESTNVPDILCLGTNQYNQLIDSEPSYAMVSTDGRVLYGKTEDEVAQRAAEEDDFEESEEVPVTLSLSEEEHELVASSKTEAERMAWKVLIRFAHVMSATEYIDIARGHIDGCTYIGPGGLEFVERLVAAGGVVSVPTTLNSVSADRQRWRQLGVPEEYAKSSVALGDAYLELGCQPSFTCAPYLLPDAPKLGQDICWGESNAVVFANSVLGARTEKYADYLDICAAIVGKTIATGVHLEENRQPQIVLDATDILADIQKLGDDVGSLDALFPTLGHLCGTLSDGMVPILVGMQDWKESVTIEHLKAFCAAFGTTGTSPLIHIAGITPEAENESRVELWCQTPNIRVRQVDWNDILTTFQSLDSSPMEEKVDLVALGNPHLSVSECETLADLVKGNQKHENIRIMACMSRRLKEEASTHVSKLERFGVEFINDTCWCMLLDPPVIPANTNATILTNSGKYAHYGPGLTNRRFRFGSMEECVQTSITGRLPLRSEATLPRWLQKRHITSGNSARKLLRFIIVHR